MITTARKRSGESERGERETCSVCSAHRWSLGLLGHALHPASGPQPANDEGDRGDGDGGSEREEQLVQDVGYGKGGGSFGGYRRLHIEILQYLAHINTTVVCDRREEGREGGREEGRGAVNGEET